MAATKVLNPPIPEPRMVAARRVAGPFWQTIRRPLIDFIIRVSRRSLAGPLRFLGRLLLFAVIAGGSGLGSAWYMIEAGSPLTVERVGPWTRWINEGRNDADPYTHARHANGGKLPLSSAYARYYLADADSDGGRLFGDCEYDISGLPLPAVWWSLAVYDSAGMLIDNDFDRYAMAGDTVVRASDGSYVVRLAQDARPGNWLPVGTDGRFVVMLRLYQSATATDIVASGRGATLPTITKVSCR